LAKLVHLERLSLSNNNLKSLPEALGEMKSLKSLHLAKNTFERIPACIFQMSGLVFLDLTSNRLTSMDSSFLSLKNTLKFLSIFDNLIDHLGAWLSEMSALEEFWFGNNLIKKVPRELTTLKGIDWKGDYYSSILDGNPIEKPPIGVCREGFEAINEWYREEEKRETTDCFVILKKL
jgi:Leucine-rich repeat (LRR) protein